MTDTYFTNGHQERRLTNDKLYTTLWYGITKLYINHCADAQIRRGIRGWCEVMGQHKRNPVAIAAKNGELPHKPPRKSKAEIDRYMYKVCQEELYRIMPSMPQYLKDVMTDGNL